MIIGVCGLMGSGKSTIGDYLQEFDFQPLSFGGAVKDAVAVIFSWDRKMLEGDTIKSRKWREVPDKFWGISPRQALQLMGTEAGRKVFGDKIWINSVRAQMKNPKMDYIITDCRFPNEAKAIQEWGGSIIMVERGEHPEWYADAVRGDMNMYPDVHASEYSVAQCSYNFLIKNNKTKEHLEQCVENVISKLEKRLDKHSNIVYSEGI